MTKILNKEDATMVVPAHFENLQVLHENTMPLRSYYIPASHRTSGLMIDRVEGETGLLTAYWNGSEGDVGPRLDNGSTAGTIADTEKLGAVAGEDALRAVAARGEYRPGELKIVCGELAVPYLAPPTEEELRAKLEELAILPPLVSQPEMPQGRS
jgi:hypothetical protein